MLFIETKTSARRVEPQARTAVLERLQERGYAPLIRAMRLGGFAQALGGEDRAAEFERAMDEWTGDAGDAPHVRGDIFFSGEQAFFLVFDGPEDDEPHLRAGLVYGPEEDEPTRRLTEFCRDVAEAVRVASAASGGGGASASEASPSSAPASASASASASSSASAASFEWREGESRVPVSFARFAAAEGQDAEASPRAGVVRGAETAERLRAVEVLEDAEGRRLLRRLGEAQAEGRTAEMLAVGATEPLPDHLVLSLAGAGLVRRELLIRCREDGRPLFRLPSADALAAITASNAVCSECGASVADERAEELVTPTPLASSMLRGGAWLLSRLRAVLSELGVPGRDVAARPSTTEADAQLMANVCGEAFLFVLRDGEFTPAHARRALDAEADAEAAHLVVVATGKIHDDARARLREHERRRARGGEEFEMILVEGVERVAAELGAAFERVAHKVLAEELYELDGGLGMSAGRLVATRFGLARRKPVVLQDLAASAAGALAGSLKEL
ncbi:MAG TPA: hypothetical protein VFX96_11090 [Pyrinomonadaceae bacterium]|nr:hypothetical protein [Pyrinomonadaceae bacterium]